MYAHLDCVIVSAVLMDLTILILTICGLWRKAALRSDIGTNLSEQCLWYCAATFLINIPAAVKLHTFVHYRANLN